MFTNSKSSNFATVGHYRLQNFIQSYTLHIEKTILFYPLNLTQARSDSRCHTHCQINKTQRLPICFIIMTFWLLLLVVCHLFYWLCFDYSVLMFMSCNSCCCVSVYFLLYIGSSTVRYPWTIYRLLLSLREFSMFLIVWIQVFFIPIQCLSTNGFQPALVFFALPIFVSWFVYLYLYSSIFRGFGFVTYKDVVSVDNCLENGPHILDGKQVRSNQPLIMLNYARQCAYYCRLSKHLH